jgi:hypothetical protein
MALVKVKNIIASEQYWVNSELKRTDILVILPDYPYTSELITYRQELRDYDLEGNRPVNPTTISGKPL